MKFNRVVCPPTIEIMQMSEISERSWS